MQSPVKERPHPLKRMGGTAGRRRAAAAGSWPPRSSWSSRTRKFFWAGLTFFVSVAAYTTIWSWRFALGFTVLLLIHEMGHVIQLRREGVPATAPLVHPVPGRRRRHEGPPARTPGSRPRSASPARCSAPSAPRACLALAVALDSDLLRALAYTGFLLNLFNLIPVLPLDGGRAAAAVHPAFWFVGLFAVALLFFMHGSTILLLIAVTGRLRAVSPLEAPQRRRASRPTTTSPEPSGSPSAWSTSR